MKLQPNHISFSRVNETEVLQQEHISISRTNESKTKPNIRLFPEKIKLRTHPHPNVKNQCTYMQIMVHLRFYSSLTLTQTVYPYINSRGNKGIVSFS